MAIEKTLEKAKTEIEKGNLWRAKEILTGSLATYGYNSELFELIGQTLIKMSDLVEAGKFLFLSDVEKSEYFDVTELFRKKYFNSSITHIYSVFPKSAKLNKLSDYPPIVANELSKLGFPEIIIDEKKNINWGIKKSKIKYYFEEISPFIFIGILVILIILGIYKVYEWVF